MTRADHRRRPGRSSKWCPKPTRLAIYLRDSFACAYCGRDLRDAEPREVGLDHLVCQSKGGTHAATNLVTACFRCNRGRGTTAWHRYATPGAVARIRRLRQRPLNLPLARAILRGDVSKAEAVSLTNYRRST